jgi:hypothetical protein
MSAKKKLSPEEFAKKFVEVVAPRLAGLPPEEQDARIAAFEKTVSKIKGGSVSKASGTAQTPSLPLGIRGCE